MTGHMTVMAMCIVDIEHRICCSCQAKTKKRELMALGGPEDLDTTAGRSTRRVAATEPLKCSPQQTPLDVPEIRFSSGSTRLSPSVQVITFCQFLLHILASSIMHSPNCLAAVLWIYRAFRS